MKGQLAALRLLLTNGGIIDVYDERVEAFSDDGQDPDTWNQLFSAGLAKQFYDTSSDNGTIRITEAGRLLLAKTTEERG